jgi:hypothetical protein
MCRTLGHSGCQMRWTGCQPLGANAFRAADVFCSNRRPAKSLGAVEDQPGLSPGIHHAANSKNDCPGKGFHSMREVEKPMHAHALRSSTPAVGDVSITLHTRDSRKTDCSMKLDRSVNFWGTKLIERPGGISGKSAEWGAACRSMLTDWWSAGNPCTGSVNFEPENGNVCRSCAVHFVGDIKETCLPMTQEATLPPRGVGLSRNIPRSFP